MYAFSAHKYVIKHYVLGITSRQNPTQLHLRKGSASSKNQRRRQRRRQRRMQGNQITRVAGLKNLKNTCFLSVVLQCQMSTPDFREALLMVNHYSRCRKTKKGRFCLQCAYYMYTAQSTLGGIIVPDGLVDNLSKFQSSYELGKQSDSQECFISLCDALQVAAKRSPCEQSSLFPVSGGKICSQRTCEQCHAVKDSYEAFQDLSVTATKHSLMEALTNFTAAEPIEFCCPRCSSKRSTKRLMISEKPKVLVIHLKRFQRDTASGTTRKIQHHIKFPMMLDLGQFLVCAERQLTISAEYDLTAVCVHHGASIANGHNTAYMLRDQNWFHANDDCISQVSDKTVLEQDAYMLFYQQRRAANKIRTNNDRADKVDTQTHRVPTPLDDEEKSVVATSNVKPGAENFSFGTKALLKPEKKSLPARRTYSEVAAGNIIAEFVLVQLLSWCPSPHSFLFVYSFTTFVLFTLCSS
jgi:ubiquitin carboxyl-terminal hydrolase 36/42